jgi:hypothetical protein
MSGAVGIATVGLGLIGMIVGVMRQRRKAGEPVRESEQRITSE